jgi:hypothetical protein
MLRVCEFDPFSESATRRARGTVTNLGCRAQYARSVARLRVISAGTS